jgi:hypothetical protein
VCFLFLFSSDTLIIERLEKVFGSKKKEPKQDSQNQLSSPMSEGGEPISEGESPMSEGEKPISEGESPMSEGEKPISEGESPISEGEKP